MLRLQNAELLVRVVPIVLCRFPRVCLFGDFFVQLRLDADILFCCLDFCVQLVDLCFAVVKLLLCGGFRLLFGGIWQELFQLFAQCVFFRVHRSNLRRGGIACVGRGRLRVVIERFGLLDRILGGRVRGKLCRVRMLERAADGAGDSVLQIFCENARLRVQKCPLHLVIRLKLFLRCVRKHEIVFLDGSQRFLLFVQILKIVKQRFQCMLAVGALLQLMVKILFFLAAILQFCLLVLERGKLLCKRRLLFLCLIQLLLLLFQQLLLVLKRFVFFIQLVIGRKLIAELAKVLRELRLRFVLLSLCGF